MTSTDPPSRSLSWITGGVPRHQPVPVQVPVGGRLEIFDVKPRQGPARRVGGGHRRVPLLSSLLGNLHPHVLCLPFVLLAVTLPAATLLHRTAPEPFTEWLERPAGARDRGWAAPSARLGIAAGDIAHGTLGLGEAMEHRRGA